MSQEPEPTDPGQQLRQHLFAGDLLELPPPEEAPEFIPKWFTGPLPVLVYPPLQEQGVSDGDTINLEVTPYHLYYGALREFAESGDEERCELLRQLVLEWNPNAALEVSRLGRENAGEDVETALLHYELAQELDPELYEAFQNGGMCHYALATAGEEDPTDALEAAEQMFRQAIELRPESGLSWWSLAYVFHAAGTPQKAEECLRQFLIHYPQASERELAEGTLQHGFPSLDLGEQLPFFLDIAAQDSVNPSQEQQIFAEAQALAFGEDPARAVELLQPLAQAYPDTGEIWFLLGAALRRSGNASEGETALRRAAQLAEREPFVWWELAQLYVDRESWSAAEGAIRKSIELDPENPIYLTLLGRSLLRQGDREGARQALEQAQEVYPDDPELQEALAELAGT